MKNLSKILWGIVLTAVGVVFALNAVGITDLPIFFDGWWTLFIIIPCLVGLIAEREKFGYLIGLLIGVFLLLGFQNIIPFDIWWKIALPAVVIMIGLRLILGGIFGSKSSKIIKEMNDEGKTLARGSATFSENNMNFDGQVFDGAYLNAAFGSIRCDLTRAIIPKDCVIKVSAVFGGIDIFLPDNISVKINSSSVFGGIEDKRIKDSEPCGITVYVTGSAVFGGVNIK